MAVFESDTTLNATPEQVFEFLIQPSHLRQISPPDMGLKFLDAPPRLNLGDTFQFMVQTLGQVQKIKHRITVFDAPTLFVEELIEGPLPKWIHSHSFVPVNDEQTLVRDSIEFEPPGGLLGLLLTESRIHDHLEDGFHHRHQQLQKLFATA